MQKKIFFLGKFYFFKKKRWFFGRYFCFLRPAFGHGRLGHPQSLEYYINSFKHFINMLKSKPTLKWYNLYQSYPNLALPLPSNKEWVLLARIICLSGTFITVTRFTLFWIFKCHVLVIYRNGLAWSFPDINGSKLPWRWGTLSQKM